ncbi:tRNA methyltransferase 10 C [Halocaridina rubra]|uniref:RNA (guanine-9-)-methyltransferase domain-containing protein 1 n=1 Tax=Halocaridina rubra TaxID=373956 RepID=A0AAN8XHH9_HALRR
MWLFDKYFQTSNEGYANIKKLENKTFPYQLLTGVLFSNTLWSLVNKRLTYLAWHSETIKEQKKKKKTNRCKGLPSNRLSTHTTITNLDVTVVLHLMSSVMLIYTKYPEFISGTSTSVFRCLFHRSYRTLSNKNSSTASYNFSHFRPSFYMSQRQDSSSSWIGLSFRNLTPCLKAYYCTQTKHIKQVDAKSITETKDSPDSSEEMASSKLQIRMDRNMSVEHIETPHSNDQSNVSQKELLFDDSDSSEPIDTRSLIELEIELLRQEGYGIPDHISPSHWEELLSKNSRKGRKKYLRFLFLNQMKSENDKKKKELKRLKREAELQNIDISANRYESEDGHIKYGLWCNTIFMRILDTSMNQYYHGRLFNAMMYGQPLVFDLGYDTHMTSKERQGCANQLMGAFASNRVHEDPFYLHFCNANRDSDLVKRLERFTPTLYNLEFPLTVTPSSYLDCFPKEKLVYLTPHCREEMKRYDHDAIYIIGGLVDLGDSEPLSLAKAKREGIKMQKFPLDRYLDWGIGGKSLTLNQTLEILLDMKNTDDWTYSLRHIPRRKLKQTEGSQERLKNHIRKSLKTNQDGRKRHSTSMSNFRIRSLYHE